MSEKTIAADLALLRQLFDPPPVLSTENRQAYDEMMRRFVECFRPQDPFEIALVKDIIDGSWEAARWGRQKSLTMHSR